MSNWSVVSVSFSGLESVSIEDVRNKLQDYEPWIVVPSCPDSESPGNACEWWMTTHVNHFDSDALTQYLRELAWKYPYEVCIVWKNESMNVPRIEMAFPELIGEVENPEQLILSRVAR